MTVTAAPKNEPTVVNLMLMGLSLKPEIKTKPSYLKTLFPTLGNPTLTHKQTPQTHAHPDAITHKTSVSQTGLEHTKAGDV